MRRPVVIALVALLALAACGSDQDPALDVAAPSSSTASAATREVGYGFVLSGDAEVPGPGDDDGSGEAEIRLVPERSEVCFEITVEGIGDPVGAHIHRGMADGSGDVVLDLPPADDGSWSGCVAADRLLIDDLVSNPGAFYVNVHDAAFPDGAVRGQLA